VNEVLCEAESSADAPRQNATHSPHRILVVDEDHDLRRLYVEALAGPGYDVDAAEDGAAGWEALQANSYNLLITENDLPKLSGVELVKKLRSARMALPVVMAAGKLPTHELARNPALQLTATLSKSFPVDALLDTVRNALCVTDGPHEQIAPKSAFR
jgi:two-component system sensor histidine kinase and response regulator WspE